MERRQLLEQQRKQARLDQQISAALRWQLERLLGQQLELGADPMEHNPSELQSYTIAQEHYTGLTVRELIAAQPDCSTPCTITTYFSHAPMAVK